MTADHNNNRQNMRSNLRINDKISSKNGNRKLPKVGSGNYQNVSSWLGQVFELENSKDNSNSHNKVVMGGFAGIKNRKMIASQSNLNSGQNAT